MRKLGLKKLISITLSLILILALSSCNKTKYQTIDPPENGWTIELLNKVTYIGGKQVAFPITLNQLPEDFSLGEKRFINENNVLVFYLLYNGDEFCICTIEDVESENSTIDNLPISQLFIPNINNRNFDFTDLIVINGVTFNSNISDIETKLGKTYETQDNTGDKYTFYYEQNSFFYVSYNSESNLVNGFIINYRRDWL
jgi:hypothetical protein